MTIGTKIAVAFLKAQLEMGNAKKDSTNPFFKTKYADLNAVREASLPVLNIHGISVLQPIIQIDGKNFVRTILLHESGETIESLTEILFNKQNDPQAQGSGITYARRYGLQSLVNIGAEDDDGNAASKTPEAKPFSKLANVADNTEMQRLKVEKKSNKDVNKKELTQEQKKQKAEEFFAKMKKDFEDCGSISEIQGLEEKNQVRIKGLDKEEYGDLYQMLLETIDVIKLQISGSVGDELN